MFFASKHGSVSSNYGFFNAEARRREGAERRNNIGGPLYYYNSLSAPSPLRAFALKKHEISHVWGYY